LIEDSVQEYKPHHNTRAMTVARKGTQIVKKDTKRISETELKAAINKFLDKGGNIQKLPPEKFVRGKRIGMKYDGTEMGHETNR